MDGGGLDTAAGGVTAADIIEARRRVGARIRRTPLTPCASAGERIGTHAYLKLEMFQKTGSFKPRGAFNKAIGSGLRPGDRVVAASGGNHAQAVAYAARELQLRATILMPRNTPANYLEATRAYGADIVLVSDIAEAFYRVAEYEREGATAIHPFDDPLVIAGQGTVGLEIVEDLPEVTDVVVSIGGGGLIAGIAIAIRSVKPGVRVWGVETEGADAMSRALAAGRPVKLPAITSIAKTLGAPEVAPRTLQLARSYIENVTVVSDDEAVRALQFLLERAKVLAEPAASCTLAAAERLRSRFDPRGHAVLVLCGGNIGAGDLCRFLAAA